MTVRGVLLLVLSPAWLMEAKKRGPRVDANFIFLSCHV